MSDDGGAGRPRGSATLFALAVLFGAAFAGLTALGAWQLQRLQWKLDLIERVDARVHASPVAAPGASEWPQITAARDEYRHVQLEGRFLPDRDTRVQAVTELGAGFWVLTPFRTNDGIVLVNRGFVPAGWRGDLPPDATRVTGLLRVSEPGGGFLRSNVPDAERWYSRDVAAIAARRGLDKVAPFFVDADATGFIDSNAAGAAATDWPRAGLTVVRFANNHLGYALTWFTLALMVAGAAWYTFRDEARLRRQACARACGKPGDMGYNAVPPSRKPHTR